MFHRAVERDSWLSGKERLIEQKMNSFVDHVLKMIFVNTFTMQAFTDLNIWQLGLELIVTVRKLTKKFPADERFGLTDQLRRASSSILINFAEGFSRYKPNDKCHKYVIARGECTETKAILLIVCKLGFITEEETMNAVRMTESVGKILSGFIGSIRKP